MINLKTAYRAVFRHLGKLIGAYFLAGVAFLCGYILLIIPGILIVMALSLTGLVVIVEDLAPMAAIQRSRDLTRGYRWRIFVSWIITSAISGAMAYILLIPVFVLIPLVLRHGAIPAWFTVVFVVAEIIGYIVPAPLIAIAFALVYYDARRQREGVDLQAMFDALPPAGALVGPPAAS
jgi:uncharacterized membrane protein